MRIPTLYLVAAAVVAVIASLGLTTAHDGWEDAAFAGVIVTLVLTIIFGPSPYDHDGGA